jgi:hypothetical protein
MKKIFESSSFHAEIGAGIFLPPNGVAVLKNILPEVNWEKMHTVDFRTASLLFHAQRFGVNIDSIRTDGDVPPYRGPYADR